jgi:hypothetical protein
MIEAEAAFGGLSDRTDISVLRQMRYFFRNASAAHLTLPHEQDKDSIFL